MFLKKIFVLCTAWLICLSSALADNTALAVWANEAIVATYTYTANDFLSRQQDIAYYFTAEGWIAYSQALTTSKLPETILKNAYEVSAVATLPPHIHEIKAGQWQAIMPLLVVYKNPSYQQKQTLEVTLTFIQAPQGQGVRGLAITRLTSKIIKPACRCP